MNIKKIYFVTDSLKNKIKEEIVSNLNSWCDTWSLSNSRNIGVEIVESTENMNFISYSLDKGQRIFATGIDLEFANLIFGKQADTVPKDEILEKIIKRSKEELLVCFINNIYEGPSKIFGSAPVGNEIFDKGVGIGDEWLIVRIKLYGYEIEIILIGDHLKFPRASNDKSISDMPGIKLKEMSNSVKLKIDIEFGNFDLKDVCDIKEGDVIASEKSIYSDFDLVLGEKKISSVKYGKIGNDMAVKLVK